MQTEAQFRENLGKLRVLEDGWLDGECKAPSKELLDWFESWVFDFFEKHFPPDSYPSAFSSFDGGLELEWLTFGLCPSLDIEPDFVTRKQQAWFHMIDPSSPGGYFELYVDLDDPADREWVGKLREVLAQPTQKTIK
jgi:hypothetical protein